MTEPSVVQAGVDWVRTYSPDEEQHLFANLRQLTTELHDGRFRDEPPTEDLLCLFHRRFFTGVRTHAGVIRKRGWGSETLQFGPNRSLHRDVVPEELDRVFRELSQSIASFDADPENPDFDRSAIRVAAWVHAEVIRIHPFEDGNGRCSRLLMGGFC